MDAEISGVEMEEPQEKQKRGDVYGAPSGDFTPRRRARRWPLFLVLGCLGTCVICCVLPACAMTIAGVGFAWLLERSEVTETRTETVALPDDQIITLEVDNRVGSVDIRPGSSDEVVVQYTKRAHSFTKAMARDELDKITVDISQPADDRVLVAVNQDNDKDTNFSIANEVDLTITVPERVYLDISSNVSDVSVRGVRAQSLEIDVNTGDITFEGTLPTNRNVPLHLEVNVGQITLRLPDDVYVAVDAQVDVGEINIAGGFDDVNQDSGGSDGPGENWRGTLGDGPEDPPTLELRVNVGDIQINTQ